MLLNLSNHPLPKWSDAQRKAAEGHFGEIVDVPFPAIDPGCSLDDVKKSVEECVQICLNLLSRYGDEYVKSHAVHIMGEYTFTYQFVKEMERRNVVCVASTTERIVTDNPDGSKTTVFQFIQFRPYFQAKL